MANQEHVDRLLQGVEAWNQWRRENPKIKSDLSDANLSDTNLINANLRHVNLINANLINANLRDANLRDTNLTNANLSYANLSDANLTNANLTNANFRDTNLSHADLSYANLSDANLINANLRDANLSYADLIYADLTNADLIYANLNYARLSDTILSGARLSGARLSGANLRNADLSYANFSDANLRDANLYDTNLSHANLSHADLSHADLSHANLSHADLSAVQALQASFQAATLTGACIEDWHINSNTNLQEIICEYVFSRYDWQKRQFTDRRPHDPNQIFAPGEFTKRYQIVLETVDLFFNDGIDWKAFLASLQDLKTQFGDKLNLQGIEKKAGGSFVVRLEVPSDADKGAVERDVKALYQTNLEVLEARYHAELHAKDREIEIYKQKSADILELAKLAAGRPIHVEAKAVAENQSSSETYTNNFSNSPIANFANKMQDQASQHTIQNIGASLDEITTLIRSLRNQVESFPEAQRTEAIDHLTDLETDLQQPPEKRKLSRIKATLLALVGIATVVSGAVTHTNEFVGQVQELSDKLGIPLPIEQLQPQSQPQAIDVQAIGSDQP